MGGSRFLTRERVILQPGLGGMDTSEEVVEESKFTGSFSPLPRG